MKYDKKAVQSMALGNLVQGNLVFVCSATHHVYWTKNGLPPPVRGANKHSMPTGEEEELSLKPRAAQKLVSFPPAPRAAQGENL